MKTKHSRYFISFVLLAMIILNGLNGQNLFDQTHGESINVFEVQKWAEGYFNEVGKGKGTGYKLYKRWEHFALRMMNDDGSLPNDAELEDAFLAFKQEAGLKSVNAVQANWTELGPLSWERSSSWSPGQGRIVSIAVEPQSQNLIYAGSPGGGVWKSEDAGQSWTPKGDQLANMTIWSIAIDPDNTNTVYIGNSSGRVLKSTNGGDSWTTTSLQSNGSIRTLLINTNNSAIILAASSSGIYRSTNSGNTWTRVSTSRTEDLLFKPGNLSVVYACGRTFQKSIDGGITWNTIGNGIVSNQRMKMSVSPAAPNNIWIVQAEGSGFGRIYKSTNSGNSFSILYDGPNNLVGREDGGGQADRDMAIAVSPNNADIIHTGGINYWRSTNGGQSWNMMASWSAPNDPSYVHADIEVMKFVGNNFYVGSDGGIYRSSNEGNNMTDLTINGLAVTQFYQMGNSQTNPSMIAAGAQDNGTMVTYGNGDYLSWIGADGFEAVINYNNSNRLFTEIQFGSLYYSSDGGQSNNYIGSPPGYQCESCGGAWLTPLEMDPVNPDVIYQAYAEVWRYNNGNWKDISTSVNFNNGANGMAMCVAPSDNNYIYVAYPNGVWRTKNAQANTPSWTQVDGHSGSVNYIHVNPNNPEHVVIATTGSRVFVSQNAGDTWQNISLNLPQSGALCVLFDGTSKNGIYVGMNPGIYYINDDLEQWIDFGQGIPNTQVTELEIQVASQKLRASTYGRGIWESDLYNTGISVPISADGSTLLCNGRSLQLQADEVFDTYQWKKDGAEISGANGAMIQVNESGRYSLLAEKNNKSGESVEIVVSNFEIDPPIVSNIDRCGPGEIELNAVASKGGTLKWYNTEDGSTSFDSGSEVIINVNASDNFYVEEELSNALNVGPKDQLSGGGNHQGNYYLVFDSHIDFTLKSALVFAEGAGNRTIVVYDAQGTLVSQKDIFIPDGTSRVNIDIAIVKGSDYRIGALDGANLFRSNAGINYPYSIDGVVDIKFSTAGSNPVGYYYYLYDWEIEAEELSGCSSERSEVVVKVSDQPSQPVTEDLVICSPGEVVALSVDGTSGLVSWYANENDTTVLGSGVTLVQDIEESKTYFVDQSFASETIYGAAENNQIGDGSMHDGSKEVSNLNGVVYRNEGGEQGSLELRMDASHSLGGNADWSWFGGTNSDQKMHAFIYFPNQSLINLGDKLTLTMRYAAGNAAEDGLNVDNQTPASIRLGLFNNQEIEVGNNSGIENQDFLDYSGYYGAFGVRAQDAPSIYLRNSSNSLIHGDIGSVLGTGTQNLNMTSEIRTISLEIEKLSQGNKITFSNSEGNTGVFDFSAEDGNENENNFNTIVLGVDDQPNLIDWFFIDWMQVEYEGSSGNEGQYLIFDALEDIELQSVLVYADGAGTRKIDLLNAEGASVASKSVFVDNGTSRVSLDFSIPAGTSYRLGIEGDANLYRNTSGASYPYMIGNLVKINSSSESGTARLSNYYYFYDWEVVSSSELCRSEKAQLKVTVENCTDVDEFEQVSEGMLFPNPTRGVINISNVLPEQVDQIRILNLQGKVLRELGYQEIIDISTFESGVYMVELKGKQMYQIKRIVVDHNE